MIENVAKQIFKYVKKHTDVNPEFDDIYKYGIEITISTILNISLVIAAALILNEPLRGVVFLGCLIPIRSYCGGYHADSYFKCNCIMVMLFLLSYCVSNLFWFSLELPFYVYLIIALGFVWPIVLFAPVKNKNKFLSEAKAQKCKIISIIIYTIFSLFGLLLIIHQIIYGLIVILTLTEVSIMILIEVIRQGRDK